MKGYMILVIVILIIVFVLLPSTALVVYLFKSREGYTSSSLSHIGGLSDYARVTPPENYDLMNNYGSQYNPYFPVQSNYTKYYEDYVKTDPNTHNSWNERRTIDRLDRIDESTLPKVSTSVTPYNVDVADPVAYSYQVHAPRVIRKDRLALEADPVRGDVPISIYPDVPIIQKSQFNRDSLRLDGTFSEALAKRYDRLTGKSYFNQPSVLSHGGMLM